MHHYSRLEDLNTQSDNSALQPCTHLSIVDQKLQCSVKTKSQLLFIANWLSKAHETSVFYCLFIAISRCTPPIGALTITQLCSYTSTTRNKELSIVQYTPTKVSIHESSPTRTFYLHEIANDLLWCCAVMTWALCVLELKARKLLANQWNIEMYYTTLGPIVYCNAWCCQHAGANNANTYYLPS